MPYLQSLPYPHGRYCACEKSNCVCKDSVYRRTCALSAAVHCTPVAVVDSTMHPCCFKPKPVKPADYTAEPDHGGGCQPACPPLCWTGHARRIPTHTAAVPRGVRSLRPTLLVPGRFKDTARIQTACSLRTATRHSIRTGGARTSTSTGVTPVNSNSTYFRSLFEAGEEEEEDDEQNKARHMI